MKLNRMVQAALAFLAVFGTSAVAFAEEGAATGNSAHFGLAAVAIALGIGLAAFGGAFGQSRAVAAALEGIARNPNASDKVFVPMILGLAFIESLVLFAWVLMFLLLGKL